MIIDGIPITDEERGKAELYFMDQQVYIHCYIETQQLKIYSLLTDKHFEKLDLDDDYIQFIFGIFERTFL